MLAGNDAADIQARLVRLGWTAWMEIIFSSSVSTDVLEIENDQVTTRLQVLMKNFLISLQQCYERFDLSMPSCSNTTYLLYRHAGR
jgi:hypothetical protein